MATTEALQAAQQADSPLLRAHAGTPISGQVRSFAGRSCMGAGALRRGGPGQPPDSGPPWDAHRSVGAGPCALRPRGAPNGRSSSCARGSRGLDRHVSKRFLGNTLNTLGWVRLDLCNWDLALDCNGRAAVEARALGDPEVIRNSELNLADCHLALGRLDEAQRYLRDRRAGVAAPGHLGRDLDKVALHTALARQPGVSFWLARGDPAKAIECADACLAVAKGATTSRRNVVKGRRLKGGRTARPGQAIRGRSGARAGAGCRPLHQQPVRSADAGCPRPPTPGPGAQRRTRQPRITRRSPSSNASPPASQTPPCGRRCWHRLRSRAFGMPSLRFSLDRKSPSRRLPLEDPGDDANGAGSSGSAARRRVGQATQCSTRLRRR